MRHVSARHWNALSKPFVWSVPMRRVSTAPASGGAEVLAGKRPRRALGEVFLHAPQTLRALVRADEIWLVLLAAPLGIGAGVLVVAMNETTNIAHHLLFLIPPGERLSGTVDVNQLRSLVVPTLGGLA